MREGRERRKDGKVEEIGGEEGPKEGVPLIV